MATRVGVAALISSAKTCVWGTAPATARYHEHSCVCVRARAPACVCFEVDTKVFLATRLGNPAQKKAGGLELRSPPCWCCYSSRSREAKAYHQLTFLLTIAPFGPRSPAASTRKGCWPEKAAELLPRRRGPSGLRPSQSLPGVGEACPRRAPDPRRLDRPPPGVRRNVPANHPNTSIKEGRGRGLRPGAFAAVREKGGGNCDESGLLGGESCHRMCCCSLSRSRSLRRVSDAIPARVMRS